MHKVGGAMRNSRPSRSCYAHFARRAAVLIIANSMVGHPLPSFFAAEFHVYVYYYTANWRRCIDISPYSVAVSYPPDSAAYAILMVPWLSHTCILACNPTSRLLYSIIQCLMSCDGSCIYVAQDTPI